MTLKQKCYDDKRSVFVCLFIYLCTRFISLLLLFFIAVLYNARLFYGQSMLFVERLLRATLMVFMKVTKIS
jgi:hypothetical protein